MPRTKALQYQGTPEIARHSGNRYDTFHGSQACGTLGGGILVEPMTHDIPANKGRAKGAQGSKLPQHAHDVAAHGQQTLLKVGQTSVRDIGWAISQSPVDYLEAVRIMEARVAAISEDRARELIWLLEHPAIYTAGTSASDADLLQPDRFPVHRTGRGGEYTYHGPGQRVVYVMMDLKRRGGDVRAFVEALEQWLITSLQALGVTGVVRPGRVGVWVARPDLASNRGVAREDKIAALGIRVRKWISYHGLSLNVAPELDHFEGIVPCGLSGFGVTSLLDLGHCCDMGQVDDVLRATFATIFDDLLPVNEQAPVIA